jgi:CHASE3 domain sensor protein
MSERRQEVSDNEPTTKPTLETLLEMLRETRDEMRQNFAAVNRRLEQIETLVDRSVSVAFEARADMRELKAQLKEHFPFVK